MTAAAPTAERPRRRRRVYLDDYEHFRGYGMTDQAIADRLGVQLDSLQQALRRARRRAEHHARGAA